VVLLGALAFIFEEVLWSRFGRLMERIGRVPAVARLESVIGRLPPYAALALFVLPLAIVWPVKLAALWLIAVGRIKSGLLLLAAGETVGAAVTARLFTLCRPALGRLGWFVRAEAVIVRCSAWAHDHIARSPLWQRTKRLAQRFAGRFRATRRQLRAYGER
jgi:hypothetical protein